jgi:hypothetical protein
MKNLYKYFLMFLIGLSTHSLQSSEFKTSIDTPDAQIEVGDANTFTTFTNKRNDARSWKKTGLTLANFLATGSVIFFGYKKWFGVGKDAEYRDRYKCGSSSFIVNENESHGEFVIQKIKLPNGKTKISYGVIHNKSLGEKCYIDYNIGAVKCEQNDGVFRRSYSDPYEDPFLSPVESCRLADDYIFSFFKFDTRLTWEKWKTKIFTFSNPVMEQIMPPLQITGPTL